MSLFSRKTKVQKKADKLARENYKGFQYAAGALLSGIKSPFDLAAEIPSKEVQHPFDEGVLAAIRKWNRLGV